MPRAPFSLAESFTLTRNLTVTKCYDPAVKAELWSTVIVHNSRRLLVDPFRDDGDAAAAVIVTNENHFRAASAIAARLEAPVYAHGAFSTEWRAVTAGSLIEELLHVIEIDGAPLGEIALHSDCDGGAVVIGDAIINFDPHGFQLLPAKYCRNQKVMRESLRQLLDLDFERMLFAHGAPILAKAKEKLRSLLEL